MKDLRIHARNCYQHKAGTSLPDTHPDAWNTVKTPPLAKEAECVGRGVIAGLEVLFFESQAGRWAQRVVARGWHEGVGSADSYAEFLSYQENMRLVREDPDPVPSDLILAGFASSTREAVIEHLEAGRSVKGMRDGEEIEVTPADLERLRKPLV